MDDKLQIPLAVELTKEAGWTQLDKYLYFIPRYHLHIEEEQTDESIILFVYVVCWPTASVILHFCHAASVGFGEGPQTLWQCFKENQTAK